MEGPIRLGIHSFLNAMPLVWPFLEGQMEHPFEITFDVPSRLADRLEEGELDVAMVPSVEIARHPDWRVIPQVAIASHGAVGTVVVVTKEPLKDVRRLAVDKKSRTSIVMIEILFRACFGTKPELLPMADDLEAMLKECQAALVIGNTAFGAGRFSKDGYRIEDLGQLWANLTQKPFVHALYAVRQGVELGQAASLLVRAKQEGLSQLPAISRRHGPRLGLSPEQALTYLRDKIVYELGPSQAEGLRTFFRMAEEMGLVEGPVEIRWYDEGSG